MIDGLFGVGWPTWAQATLAIEVVAPLAVAVFAVWLGFYYQRVLADRAEQRVAFVSAFQRTGAMLDMIELQESLRYALFSLETAAAAGAESVPPAVLTAADDRFASLANRLGFDPSPERPQVLEDGRVAFASPSPLSMSSKIVARFNSAQIALRDDHLRILMADPGSMSRPRMVLALAAFGRLEEEMSIAFEGLSATDVRAPDWQTLTKYHDAAQLQVYKLMGGESTGTMYTRQYREEIPWPKDVRDRGPVRAPSRTPPTLYDGPSATFWFGKKR